MKQPVHPRPALQHEGQDGDWGGAWPSQEGFLGAQGGASSAGLTPTSSDWTRKRPQRLSSWCTRGLCSAVSKGTSRVPSATLCFTPREPATPQQTRLAPSLSQVRA